MATADELLTMTMNDSDNKTLIIDNDFRTIVIPPSVTLLGTEAEKDVHRLYFQMPRYSGDIDLSELNIRINYMNAKKQGDIYVVTDKKVLSSTITFSWLVGPNALAYKGNTKFIVCLKESDTEGNILREFNTTVATLPVLEGLEVDASTVSYELMDVLEQLQSLTESKVAEVEAAGTEQVAKVAEKSTEEQENIANKGAEVLATIPEDYQTTYKLANEGVRSKADAIVCSAEGETISVTDSSDDNLRGLKIFGKSKQFTTTGKNLLPYPYTYDTRTTNGVDITVNSDGSILINGTATAGISFHLATTFTLPVGEYILSGCSSGGSLEKYRIYFSDNVTKTVADYGSSSTFTLTESFTGQVVIQIFTGAALNNLMFYPMIRLASVADGTYEPYTGGSPAPNPDYPQEIVSVENPTISVYKKNLLPSTYASEYVTYNGITYADAGDGKLAVSGTATANSSFAFASFAANKRTFIPAGTYTVSGNPSGGVYFGFYLYDSQDASDHSQAISRIINGNSWTFTIDEDSYYGTYIHVPSGNTVSAIISPQLEMGDQATAYEPPCTCQNLDVLNHTLPGIPVTSGGNYTDSDGQQWICDEVDFERGVYVQRVKSDILDGNEGWNMRNADYGDVTYFYAAFADMINDNDENPGAIMCDSFIESYGINTIEHIRVHGMAGQLMLFIKTSRLDDVSVTGLKAWLTEHNVNIMYRLATPIETSLTADEIEAFKALRSNYPNTTVLNDSSAKMFVRYNADLEIWLRRLIDERIAAAIDSLPSDSTAVPAAEAYSF